jgi:hypothetical protein
MKAVIKLTNEHHEEILIGVASIIDVQHFATNGMTRVRSRGAMVTTNFVLQSVEEIYEQINS